jgi:hypothetical protein
VHRVCCCDPPGGCPACFCASNSASAYIATWVSGINPTGLVATFNKDEVWDRFCAPGYPQCGFHHNNYNYQIELQVRQMGSVVVTKLPTGGATACGCYYQGFGVFNVVGFVEISAPLSNCGGCPNFLRTIPFDVYVEGCLQVHCGSANACSPMSGPSEIRHQLQLCDTQLRDSITMVEHDWEHPGVCPEVAVGLRLLPAVMEWTSTCEMLDAQVSNDRRMVSQEHTEVIVCDPTVPTQPCIYNLVDLFSIGGVGSFGVMFTDEYSVQDPAPQNCFFQIPAGLGLIPITPGNGFTGSNSPFRAKCQNHLLQSNCYYTTMSFGVLPCTYA